MGHRVVKKFNQLASPFGHDLTIPRPVGWVGQAVQPHYGHAVAGTPQQLLSTPQHSPASLASATLA